MKKLITKPVSLMIVLLLSLFLLRACSEALNDENISGSGMAEFPAFTSGTLKSSNLSDGFDYAYTYSNVYTADLDAYVQELETKGFNKSQGNSYSQIQYSKSIGDTGYNANIFWGNSIQPANELYLNFEIEP